MTEDTDLFIRLKDDYREALEQCNDSLLRLESNPDDRDSLENASRQLHNIKGFAPQYELEPVDNKSKRLFLADNGTFAHGFHQVIDRVDALI